MPYANTSTKRDQVLERLRSNLAAIAPPDFSHAVRRVYVYEGGRLVIGGEMPALAILPIDDERIGALACSQDEYRMTVQVIGIIRVDPSTNIWKGQIGFLAGDIQQALSNDRQLNELATYVEVLNVDVSDTTASGNKNVAVCNVTATIVYRVGVADVTT